MIDYIKPECMPFYYYHNIRKDKSITQGIAYTADGFLLPCCWCDALSTKKDIEHLGFYNENLKLKNNTSVENILQSDIFYKFIKIVSEDPNNAPKCCREKCGTHYE